jgi:hypothetical protein
MAAAALAAMVRFGRVAASDALAEPVTEVVAAE